MHIFIQSILNNNTDLFRAIHKKYWFSQIEDEDHYYEGMICDVICLTGRYHMISYMCKAMRSNFDYSSTVHHSAIVDYGLDKYYALTHYNQRGYYSGSLGIHPKLMRYMMEKMFPLPYGNFDPVPNVYFLEHDDLITTEGKDGYDVRAAFSYARDKGEIQHLMKIYDAAGQSYVDELRPRHISSVDWTMDEILCHFMRTEKFGEFDCYPVSNDYILTERDIAQRIISKDIVDDRLEQIIDAIILGKEMESSGKTHVGGGYLIWEQPLVYTEMLYAISRVGGSITEDIIANHDKFSSTTSGHLRYLANDMHISSDGIITFVTSQGTFPADDEWTCLCLAIMTGNDDKCKQIVDSCKLFPNDTRVTFTLISEKTMQYIVDHVLIIDDRDRVPIIHSWLHGYILYMAGNREQTIVDGLRMDVREARDHLAWNRVYTNWPLIHLLMRDFIIDDMHGIISGNNRTDDDEDTFYECMNEFIEYEPFISLLPTDDIIAPILPDNINHILRRVRRFAKEMMGCTAYDDCIIVCGD